MVYLSSYLKFACNHFPFLVYYKFSFILPYPVHCWHLVHIHFGEVVGQYAILSIADVHQHFLASSRCLSLLLTPMSHAAITLIPTQYQMSRGRGGRKVCDNPTLRTTEVHKTNLFLRIYSLVSITHNSTPVSMLPLEWLRCISCILNSTEEFIGTGKLVCYWNSDKYPFLDSALIFFNGYFLGGVNTICKEMFEGYRWEKSVL